MPTYEYACKSCSHQFAIRQKMSDDALTSCPECGGPIERIISGGAGLLIRKEADAPPCGQPGCGMEGACRDAAERFGAPPCHQH